MSTILCNITLMTCLIQQAPLSMFLPLLNIPNSTQQWRQHWVTFHTEIHWLLTNLNACFAYYRIYLKETVFTFLVNQKKYWWIYLWSWTIEFEETLQPMSILERVCWTLLFSIYLTHKTYDFLDFIFSPIASSKRPYNPLPPSFSHTWLTELFFTTDY